MNIHIKTDDIRQLLRIRPSLRLFVLLKTIDNSSHHLLIYCISSLNYGVLMEIQQKQRPIYIVICFLLL